MQQRKRQITMENIKTVKHANNHLKSLESAILGPDHCDIKYIGKDIQTDTEETVVTDATVIIKKEGSCDSMSVDIDIEIKCEDKNYVANSNFDVSNEEYRGNRELVNTIPMDNAIREALNRKPPRSAAIGQVTDTETWIKCESATIKCAFCLEEFSDELAYHGHICKRLQNGDRVYGTSQVCKPHTAVSSHESSCYIENKDAIQRLCVDLHPNANWSQTYLAPLSAKIEMNNDNEINTSKNEGTMQKRKPVPKTINGGLLVEKRSSVGNNKINENKKDNKNNVIKSKNNVIKSKSNVIKSEKAQDGLTRKRQKVTVSSRDTQDFDTASRDTEKKLFICDTCQNKFIRKDTLVRHIKTHTGEKPFSCKDCEYTCARRSLLENHMRIHTGEKPYSCDVCDYRCAIKNGLARHNRTHTGEKPHTCALCEYRCVRKRQLENHMRTHTGQMPYICDVCNYKCAEEIRLVVHMRTHTGEKPYSCTVCSFKSAQHGDLVVHMRTHTGEKPYSCKMCDYKCSQNSNLVIHMRTHTGEKPYACDVCDYRCAQIGQLTMHKRRHTGEKPYFCTSCHYKCAQKSHLVNHMKIHAV